MKIRFLATILSMLLFTVALPLYAQNDQEKEYTQLFNQSLAEGNCTAAQSFYEVYQQLLNRTNPDIERRIEKCLGQDSATLENTENFIRESFSTGDWEMALNVYNNNRDYSYNWELEYMINIAQLWNNGYFDDCVDDKARFNAGIVIPMITLPLNTVAERRLKSVADFVKKHPETKEIRVVGFCPPFGGGGSDVYSHKVSMKIAKNVKSYFVSQGIDENMIEDFWGARISSITFARLMMIRHPVVIWIYDKVSDQLSDYYKKNAFGMTEYNSSIYTFYTKQCSISSVGEIVTEKMLENGSYVGEKNDNNEPNGKGVIYFDSWDPYGRASFEADFVSGKTPTKGAMRWRNGCSYEGEFKNGKMTGKGIFRWPNGDEYTGEFLDGEKHGQGTYIWAIHNSYTGSFNCRYEEQEKLMRENLSTTRETGKERIQEGLRGSM